MIIRFLSYLVSAVVWSLVICIFVGTFFWFVNHLFFWGDWTWFGTVRVWFWLGIIWGFIGVPLMRNTSDLGVNILH